ncbi:unnamed protein product [Owenia fusiformis]|uniref:Uncharacterized protein n=1 Tax=Owenia fusiformis TaxID=6347 RepID=A0A8J1Y5C2_OWEFU|nr:unnamed protein product [Owenia fusiformis]
MSFLKRGRNLLCACGGNQGQATINKDDMPYSKESPSEAQAQSNSEFTSNDQLNLDENDNFDAGSIVYVLEDQEDSGAVVIKDCSNVTIGTTNIYNLGLKADELLDKNKAYVIMPRELMKEQEDKLQEQEDEIRDLKSRLADHDLMVNTLFNRPSETGRRYVTSWSCEFIDDTKDEDDKMDDTQ